MRVRSTGAPVAQVANGPRWSRHWFGGFDERCPDFRLSEVNAWLRSRGKYWEAAAD